MREHTSGTFAKSHTHAKGITLLVYYETYETLKKLARPKKFALVDKNNPHCANLAASWGK